VHLVGLTIEIESKILQRFKLCFMFTIFNVINFIYYLFQRAASCYAVPCLFMARIISNFTSQYNSNQYLKILKAKI